MSDPRPVRPTKTVGERVAFFGALVVLGGLAWMALMPLFFNERNGHPRNQCRHNLKTIGLALQNYHDVYGSLPPAIVYGPDGTPWHSWRTLLLPFVEHGELYARYRFDEPWDGPNNRKLAEQAGTIPVYVCPKDEDAAPGLTSYFAVVGERTMWPPDGSLSFDDVPDGLGNTLHVVEVSDSGVHWMEPRDLRFDRMTFEVGAEQGVGIRGRHGGTDRWIGEDVPPVANVGLADGSVRAIGGTMSPETVRSLLLQDDGGPEAF